MNALHMNMFEHNDAHIHARDELELMQTVLLLYQKVVQELLLGQILCVSSLFCLSSFKNTRFACTGPVDRKNCVKAIVVKSSQLRWIQFLADNQINSEEIHCRKTSSFCPIERFYSSIQHIPTKSTLKSAALKALLSSYNNSNKRR